MQFHIPQFIDIEDKIFGPFTFKHFVYVVGAAGATFLWYSIFPIYFAILLILPTIALAFYAWIQTNTWEAFCCSSRGSA